MESTFFWWWDTPFNTSIFMSSAATAGRWTYWIRRHIPKLGQFFSFGTKSQKIQQHSHSNFFTRIAQCQLWDERRDFSILCVSAEFWGFLLLKFYPNLPRYIRIQYKPEIAERCRMDSARSVAHNGQFANSMNASQFLHGVPKLGAVKPFILIVSLLI